MRKLVCDRCGRVLDNPADIELVMAGMTAWQNSVRARGEEPRGVFPCEHYIRCGGEMIFADSVKKRKSSSRLKKLFGV
jgi:hypothetical protein